MHVTSGPRLLPAPLLHPQLHSTAHAADSGCAFPLGASDLYGCGSGLILDSLPGTCADVDDAIMESMETELYEPDVVHPSQASAFTASSSQILSSSAINGLAMGFGRLPDRPSSACSTATPRATCPPAGGAGSACDARAAAASAASAALMELLRGDGGGGAPVAGNGIGGGAAATATTAGGGDQGASLLRNGSVVAVSHLALKPAGVSHDGVLTPYSGAAAHNGHGLHSEVGQRRQPSLTAITALPAVGVAAGVALASPFSTASSDTACVPVRSVALPLGHQLDGGVGGGHDARHESHSAAAALQSQHCLQASFAAASASGSAAYAGSSSCSQYGVAVQQPHSPYGYSPYGSETTGAMASGAVAAAAASGGGGGGGSSSASTIHPALAHVLAEAASVGGGGGVAPLPLLPCGSTLNLNLPFMTAAPGSGSGSGTSAEPSAQALGGWGLNEPIGPVPVPAVAAAAAAGVGAASPRSGLVGSIAAAAFRSVSSTAGHPSLAAPGLTSGVGSNSISASLAASRDSAGCGPSGLSGTADLGRHRHHTRRHTHLSHSEPWTSGGAPSQGASLATAAAAMGPAFSPPQLFYVLPDVSGSGASKYGDPAGAAAGGGGCMAAVASDADAITAAVRAMLRLDPPLDLPYTHPVPPLDYEAVVAAPSSTGQPGGSSSTAAADGDCSTVGGSGAFAPVIPPPVPLPPLPVPASVLDALQPCGVPAVDRYLRQLLQDSSAERHVFLCKRPLSAAACQAVASCLRVCPGVKSITLSYCCITCEGMTALCEGLRACRDLLVLDLSHNSIADLGASVLAACLPDMPLLASLALVGNPDLGDPGVAELAAAARSCAALRRIGLRGTAATSLGVRELASALAGNLRRQARRASGVAGGGPGSPVAAAAGGGGAGGGDRPVTWDGAGGTAAAAAVVGDGVFIAQLCTLLRTLVQPALAAEQAVAEAVVELMATVEEAGPPSVAAAAAPAASAATSSSSASSPSAFGELAAAAGAGGGASAAGGDFDLLSCLAEGLRNRGYDVAVTHALGGGSGGECLRNLRHRFLSVSCPLQPGVAASGPPSPAAAAVAAASLARSASTSSLHRRGIGGPASPPPPVPYHSGVIIVDPELREQFEVAMPTPRYEALVAALPRVYVGAEERLPLVVEVLCDEMALALRSKGLVIPPWRESAAMISKWQPKQSRLLVPGAAPAAVGGGGAGPASGSTSAYSSGSVTPRVSLAGGMAAVAAAANGTAPMLVHWRHENGGGAATAGGGGASAAGGRRPPPPRHAGDGEEPSLGPAPSLGSASGVEGSFRPDSGSMVQSFGFRRCTSTNSLSLSVGLASGPIASGLTSAAAAATPTAAGALADGTAMSGLISRGTTAYVAAAAATTAAAARNGMAVSGGVGLGIELGRCTTAAGAVPLRSLSHHSSAAAAAAAAFIGAGPGL